MDEKGQHRIAGLCSEKLLAWWQAIRPSVTLLCGSSRSHGGSLTRVGRHDGGKAV